MHRVEVTTKPNGSGRTWLEVGNFEVDEFGRQNWIKKNIPHQDRNLKLDRRHSDRGETIDWILMIPDDYDLTLVRVKYDRLNPRELELLWTPNEQNLNYQEKINRAYELARENDELISLLTDLLPPPQP
ncbi:TPA: hypothetical protein EYN98_09980 [Candidatus Poribacteria bacterium]|nr:hypothetical protein [Candidatus Poribacteria bacterium]HIA66371.1 hypothetical protein [Candidatus Poribacteria bacterium]HIC18778.1 hypothetical protein [Candidatus Poribacteria bacterium]HIM12726.1 hypothetical protein [Candidatus Poribacteria bacterium]HIO08175.1 hypothetical protein [Candidatus Poribacteria bacterium]